jgi:hypothetical protein
MSKAGAFPAPAFISLTCPQRMKFSVGICDMLHRNEKFLPVLIKF